ncbi:MAG: PAS domain S-box protein, partial [Patescibacteria group bacterium]|nr:PAS domain S-box protein [Patescibacteria group bacterium]
SEQRLAATLRSIGDAVVTCDPQGRVRSLNRVAETLTGWSDAEAAGRAIDNVFRVVDFPSRGDIAVDRLLRGEETIASSRHAILMPSRGAECHIAMSGAAIRDDSGAAIGTVLVFRDISEETRRSDDLLRSERLLQAIVDGSPIPQFVIDRQHRITHWNKALATYSGMSAQDMLGTPDAWRAFYDQARPCMADLVVDGAVDDMATWYGDRYRRSRLVEGAFEASGFFEEAWGGVWLDFTAAPLRDAEGAVIGAVETLIDVTKRKEAESRAMVRARFSTALNQVDADAVYRAALRVIADEIDAPLVALFAGDAKALRCRCAVGVDHQLLDHQHFAPEGLPLAVAETGDVVAVVGPFDDIDLRVRVGLGEVELHSVVGWPIRFQDRPAGVLLTALTKPLADDQTESIKLHLEQLAIRMQTIQIDAERSRLLSELRRQARGMERAKGDAERANLAKSTFLASISHEFRTPMNSILGFTARLAGRKSGHPMSERDLAAVEIIDRNARELLEMITGILALSRIEAGKA